MKCAWPTMKHPVWRNGEVLSERHRLAFYCEWYQDGDTFGCPVCGGASYASESESRCCRYCGHLCLESDQPALSSFTLEERVDFQSAWLVHCCSVHGEVGCNGQLPDRSFPHQILDLSVPPVKTSDMPSFLTDSLRLDRVYPTPVSRQALDVLFEEPLRIVEVVSGSEMTYLLEILEHEWFVNGSESGFWCNRDSLMEAYRAGHVFTCKIGETDRLFSDQKLRKELRECSERLFLQRCSTPRPVFLLGSWDTLVPCFLALDAKGTSIDFLWVHPVIRHRGVGEALVMSQPHVKTHIRSALPESRGFWTKMGFTYALNYKHIKRSK